MPVLTSSKYQGGLVKLEGRGGNAGGCGEDVARPRRLGNVPDSYEGPDVCVLQRTVDHQQRGRVVRGELHSAHRASTYYTILHRINVVCT